MAALRAGIGLVRQINEIFNRQNLETLEDELQVEHYHLNNLCQQAAPAQTGVFRHIIELFRSRKEEKRLLERIHAAAERALQNMDPAERETISRELNLTKKHSLRKLLRQEFKILKHTKRAELHADKAALESHFVVEPQNHEEQNFEIVDKASRMNAAKILEQQTEMRLQENTEKLNAAKNELIEKSAEGTTKEVVRAVMQTIKLDDLFQYIEAGAFPSEVYERLEMTLRAQAALGVISESEDICESIKRVLRQFLEKAFITIKLKKVYEQRVMLQNQKKQYLRQSEIGEWRTSNNAQLAHRSRLSGCQKRHMVTNPWIETVTVEGEAAPLLRVGRTGAFTDFADPAHNIIDMEADGATDPELLESRKQIVMDQLLTAFVEHGNLVAGELKRKINNGEPCSQLAMRQFHYSQISLLTPKGKELNMLKDITWAMQKLNGKAVIFDGQCGIDKDGNVHIPHLIGDPQDPLTLVARTTLYNFAVHTKPNRREAAHQNPINNVAMTKLQERYNRYRAWLEENGQGDRVPDLEQRWLSIRRAYLRGTSNYQIASQIVQFESLLNASTGVNCKSGKDRTSYLIKLIISEQAEARLPNPNRRKRKTLNSQIMKKGIGYFITGLNTGVKALKVRKIKMLGLSILERIGMLFLAYNIAS